MNSQIIQFRADYEVALKRVSQLVDLDPMRGTTLGDEFETLGMQVQAYEALHFPVDLPNSTKAIYG